MRTTDIAEVDALRSQTLKGQALLIAAVACSVLRLCGMLSAVTHCGSSHAGCLLRAVPSPPNALSYRPLSS